MRALAWPQTRPLRTTGRGSCSLAAVDEICAEATGPVDVEIGPRPGQSPLRQVCGGRGPFQTDVVRSKEARLEVLVNNAGLMVVDQSKTEDGFEKRFGVYHLGHFALTASCCRCCSRRPGRAS
jgi:NAD(P)-dependent dehydrogenase (short-subunit alcohol dehydrogenase family)